MRPSSTGLKTTQKPREITPEEANRIGYETAMRWTKGNYAFFVATHTDRQHIHNHIYYNSTSLKKIADILFLLKEMQKNTGKKVSVIWAYEDGDDSSQENGEDLCYALDLPLELRVKTYDEDE